jgi:glutamate/tyrosine decarboxylase-like PLP-dependent enzyme
MEYENLLSIARERALGFLGGIRQRRVNAAQLDPTLRLTDLPADGLDPIEVLHALADLVERDGLATAGPRYFGFVIGGALPVTVATDWLVSAWDQNAALHVMSPAVAAIEDCAGAWLLDLFGLPASCSVGFVTGATMANATALAAARDEVLRREGWDVEANGLQGAPRVTIIAGREAHASIESACRLLGFGSDRIVRVDADGQGRMLPEALKSTLAQTRPPAIVCLQAGHVNTGAFDPMTALIDLAHSTNAWVHVDGAFGLWARTVERLRPLAAGVDGADSWAVDAHKWLNVPYDSGVAMVRHPAAHRASMAQTASYLLRAQGERRDGMDWTPEASRRARAVPIYAALATLGRTGVAALVNRCCELAFRMGDCLRRAPGIEVLNEIVLNQVLVRMRAVDGTNVTRAVIDRIQQGSVCWVGGATWHGEPAMRISVSNWSTTPEDIDASANAIITAAGGCS